MKKPNSSAFSMTFWELLMEGFQKLFRQYNSKKQKKWPFFQCKSKLYIFCWFRDIFDWIFLYDDSTTLQLNSQLLWRRWTITKCMNINTHCGTFEFYKRKSFKNFFIYEKLHKFMKWTCDTFAIRYSCCNDVLLNKHKKNLRHLDSSRHKWDKMNLLLIIWK